MNIPFALPYLDEREEQEILESLRSNWLSRGPKTSQFEQAFAQYVESAHAIGLNSCTAGLHLSLLAASVGPGDEVITTPFTFVATANTILHCGAKPVFVDIDPLTLNLDPQLLEAAITPRTKAIIPVHFAGYPCEMEVILELAAKHRLIVIEDAAHAVGTKYRDRPIGSISHLTCFSFYATKNLTTGEGGMVTTQDEELAERIRVMSLHGMSKNAWNRYSEQGSWYYEVNFPGFKYNMTDTQAALGIVQLAKFQEMQERRKKIAGKYHEILSHCQTLLLPYDNQSHEHSWHMYAIRLKQEKLRINRNQLIEQLKEAGIGTSVHFIPVVNHPYYRKLGYQPEAYPQTQQVYESVLSLPLYPGLSDEAVEYVAQTVRSIITGSER